MTYQEWLGFMQQYLQSVEKYSSIYSGQQIDTAVGKALNPDTTPTASSSALITSGGVKSALDSLFTTGVQLYSGNIQVGSNITLSDNINNYRAYTLIDQNTDGESTQAVNVYFGSSASIPSIIVSIVEYNAAYTVMVLADIALTSSDGIHYSCVRSAQMNLGSNGVEYFSGNASTDIVIIGYK